MRRAAYDERARRQERPLTHRERLESRFWIRDKHNRLIPFLFNRMQECVWDEIVVDGWLPLGLEVDVLKARKLGSSTFWLNLFFEDTITNERTNTAVICKKPPETEDFRLRMQRLYKHLPADERPMRRYDNPSWLTFPGLDSVMFLGTAGVQDIGRAMDSITNLLATEVAFWPHEPDVTWAAVSRAVPVHGRRVRESTANGIGNIWNQWWEQNKAKGVYRSEWGALIGKAGRKHFFFFPWWWDEEAVLDLSSKGKPLDPPHTEEEAWLVEKYGLTDQQIAWRRWAEADDPRLFFQECAEDDVSCFLGAGNCVFDTRLLRELLKRAQENEPVHIGENGALIIWELPHPEEMYVAGSDVAGGDPVGDYSATGVLKWRTGEQVAVLRGRLPPDTFARKSAALCASYNDALWGVESAEFGHAVLSQVYGEPIGYRNLFWHEALTGGREKLGWVTNRRTRPTMLTDLEWALREGMMGVNDPEFIRECLSFVRTEKYPDGEAQQGCHDDLIFAWGIAWQMRRYVKRPGETQIVRDTIPYPMSHKESR